MVIYPAKQVGQLIKRYRLEQNMSQETLCKGICAISYLSKIESGLVMANEEIILALFKALHINYITNDNFLALGKDSLAAFFKAYFFQYTDECKRLFNLLEEHEEDYLFSPLMIDYLLAKVYDSSLHSTPVAIDRTIDILKELSLYEQTLSPEQYFYFLYLQGFIAIHFTKDYDSAINLLKTANGIRQTPAGLALLSDCYFAKGLYPLSIDVNEEAFQLAIREGNIFWALNSCITQAGSYSNMKNPFLMLKYYNRALNLCEGIGDLYYKESIYYNLGATYLTLKDYQIALSYCLKSLALAQLNHNTNVSLYHKLALIYIELHTPEEAKAYLSLAYKDLERDEETCKTCMKEALDLVALRIKDKNYLYNPEYLYLLEYVYKHIENDYHFGFKQFHGDYLITCYKANRRYKDALRITEELYLPSSDFLKYTY